MLNTIFMTFIETAPMSNFELATIILSSISLLHSYNGSKD